MSENCEHSEKFVTEKGAESFLVCTNCGDKKKIEISKHEPLKEDSKINIQLLQE